MIFKVLILLTCAVNLGCSVTVELYSEQNYSGLLKRAIVNQEDDTRCMQLDQTYEVKSLKTEKCVMVYETGNCKRIDTKLPEGSKMYSIRIESDTALFKNDGAYPNRKEERGVQSFRLCGNEPGAGLLNVDIYSDTYYTGNLVASYEGVCKCKNIPNYITLKGKPFSIDNHGKNMYFYDKEDCGGQERFIPAGDSERSRYVTHLDPRAVVIRSFRLADSKPCPNLDASVHKFTFRKEDRPAGSVAQQNKTYTTTNTEHTDVLERIKVGCSIRAEYIVAKPFTYIHTTRVKAGVLMESKDDIIQELGTSLQSSLEVHYQYSDTNQNTITTAVIKQREVSNFVTFRKPPCTTCTVNVSINKWQEIPTSYIAEAIVTGVAGGNKVSAEQIRNFLPPGMKYVKKNDDYSVVVTVQEDMKCSVDYPYPGTEESCLKLPDCDPHLRVDL